MTHPLFWPTKYCFYPIGNTSAVSLNTDIAPEEPARILLLGCGDPRNVLYTIFTEPPNAHRTLDFTCSDFDPAVLARNVLLLTMVADGQACATIWNIFFHFRLDSHSHTALVNQCKKLIALSETTQEWRTSQYASSIKICTEYTLSELRRHWILYVGMQDLPNARLAAVHSAFDQQCKKDSEMVKITFMCARSLGPLFVKGLSVVWESFSNFWATGVTFVDQESITAATLLNPTFVYSLGGEGCSLHYGTDPLVPFHFAALFGNAKATVSITEVVKAAMQEFTDWCTSYATSLSSTSPPIIRFFVGEANAVCRALFAFGDTGTVKLGIPVSHWKTELIQLSANEYKPAQGGAPVSFNVIHTSNLVDHIGLLNILVACIPLLSQETPCVLYTKSLLSLGEDATKEFKEHLHADLSVMGVLVGLCPVDYLCGFSTRSNTHELLIRRVLKDEFKKNPHQISQFHQVTTWKVPTSGDTTASQNVANISRPSFDECQLGNFLYDVYQSLFGDESATTFSNKYKANISKAIFTSYLAHFTREGFVLLLKLIQHRLLLSEEAWTAVMDRFMTLEVSNLHIEPMEAVHHKDLCVQLHRHGIYRAPFFHINARKIGRYSDWDTVPDLVRIILIIPRKNLAVLEHSKAEEISTPPLHCQIFGVNCLDYFTSVDVAFGRAVSTGSKSHPRVAFEEDVNGWEGESPLVASFVVPAWLLSDQEPPRQLSVGLGVYNTPAALMTLGKKLGLELRIFSAKLLDETLVHVLPEQPLPSRYSPQSPHPPKSTGRTTANMLTQIGQSGATSVELDQECELISSLTIRVSITDGDSLKLFSEEGSKVVPEITQLSPCVIRIKLGGKIQDITYPFPVIGNADARRLRGARKSRYIEVVVPPSRSLLRDGMKLNPFPVISTAGRLNPWSIHRVNLSTLPILNLNKEHVKAWLNPHVASMMSSREATLKKKQKVDTLMFVKDTLHSIFVRASGIQDTPVQRFFALLDKKSKNCDTIFFISDLRFDLASHTMISDGYVLPLTPRVLREQKQPFEALLKGGIVHIPVFEGEMRVWKQLLPAFVERCRSSWKHQPNCEYMALGRIPLTEDMEEDADPLCSCGRGKDVEGMRKVALWKAFTPYVTRVALSPLFGVSYLETVARGPADYKCSVCRKRGNPSLQVCVECRKVRYCSRECQKVDQEAHKAKCTP